MTFKRFRDIVGRLTLLGLLAFVNMYLVLKRAADPSGSLLEQTIGLSLDPVLIGCVLVVLFVPPVWLGRRFPRLRAKLSGYLGMLLVANGVALLGLLLAGKAPVPASEPSPSPVVKRRVPVQPVRRTTVEVTPALETSPLASPTPATFPTPVASPSPMVSPTPVASSSPVASRSPQAVVKPDPVRASKAAREAPFAEIDAHALAAPENVETDIARLAEYLVKPAKNDREKIRAIHRWVADRIAYDTVSFFSGQRPDQSAENTLRNRLSVCAGYANLVHALAEAGGVETVVIGGYGRSADSTEEKREEDSHAWNAVKLDGQWRLLDATWSAGNVGQDQKFHKEYNDFYFLTDAQAFGNDHWPEEEKWQLVQPAVSRADFYRQPLLASGFYSTGLKLPPGTTFELTAHPVAVLAIDVPKDVLLMATLEDDQGLERKGAVTVFRQGTRATVSVKAPKAGEYGLSLFAGSGRSSRFEGVAEFKVTASRGDENGYPEVFTPLQEVGGKVSAPMKGVVAAGPQQFDLQIPGATKVFVDDWDQTLTRDGDRFTGQVDLKVGEAKVYAQFDQPSAKQIASYRVRYKAE